MTQDEDKERREEDAFAKEACGEVAEAGLRGCIYSATVLALLFFPLAVLLD